MLGAVARRDVVLGDERHQIGRALDPVDLLGLALGHERAECEFRHAFWGLCVHGLGPWSAKRNDQYITPGAGAPNCGVYKLQYSQVARRAEGSLRPPQPVRRVGGRYRSRFAASSTRLRSVYFFTSIVPCTKPSSRVMSTLRCSAARSGSMLGSR